MASAEARPSVALVLVMGVSGAGKTSVARLLAERLGWELLDADALHPPANLRKLSDGTPLTDADRWPWLREVAARIDQAGAQGRRLVVACSALRRSYRELLIGRRDGARLVYLKGDPELLGRRMRERQGHFMPPSLLQSQLDTLEEPRDEEKPIVVAIDATPRDITERIVEHIAA